MYLAAWRALISAGSTGDSLQLFEGVGAELVGHPLFHAVALNDVPRLHVIGEEHHLLTLGAARLLDLGDRPGAVPFARPEREARSVGAIEDFPARDPGRDLDGLPSPVAECSRHRLPHWAD